MGTVANALNMLFILSSGGTYTIRELAQRLEVSSKSIRVYRDALDGAGIYVLEKRGRGGGYHLPRDFQNTLVGLELNEEEYWALDMLNGELQSSGHVEAKHITSILTKLKLARERRELHQGEPARTTSHIMSGARPNIDSVKEGEKLGRVIQAKRSARKLSLRYRSLSQTVTKRVLQVYSTYTYRGEIYLVAFCELRGEVRDFKLRRADNLELLEERYSIPDDFSVREYMKNCIGIFKGSPMQVELIVREPFAQIVRETIYSDDQTLEERPDDRSLVFRATMRGIQEVVAWILSMGRHVTVLGPPELEGAVRSEHAVMADQYTNR